MADADWKKRVGIQINYSPGQSSDEDDIVIRNSPGLPRGRAYQHVRAGQLIEDKGMGSDADLLGTTPPRARIRDKERKRQNINDNDASLCRLLRNTRRNTVDAFIIGDVTAQNDYKVGRRFGDHHPYAEMCYSTGEEKRNKRRSAKFRGRARDSKAEWSGRADSTPVPDPEGPAAATLVETCNRFMSLSCRPYAAPDPRGAFSLYAMRSERDPVAASEGDPTSNRVQFHRMFSMLIKMGSNDKTCRRTISMEEKVYLSELMDLIWLEIRAKLAGQTPSQHDAELISQRKIVPVLIQNIINYRFINDQPCYSYHGPIDADNGDSMNESTPLPLECLSICCDKCSDILGKALKEVGTLLDSFSNAESLYPSSKAMAAHHPLVATQLFSNRLKALCLWNNIARHLRLSMLVLRKLNKILQLKQEAKRRRFQSESHTDSASRKSSLSPLPLKRSIPKPSTVKFEMDSNNPSDSNSSSAYSENSEVNSDSKKDSDEPDNTRQIPEVIINGEISDDSKPDSNYHSYNTTDTSDCEVKAELFENAKRVLKQNELSGMCGEIVEHKPNIINFPDKYKSLYEGMNIFEIGSLKDLTHLKLYGNCETSPYRVYLEAVLKTKGLRNALKIVDKLNHSILKRANVTLQKYNAADLKLMEGDEIDKQHEDTDSEVEKEITRDIDDAERDTLEMKRYGCWSEESNHMKLPSYRSAYLFLAAIPMELIHEYMLYRLERKPDKPSALSIKQLIYEYKEGLDVAANSRALYVRHVDTALESVDPSGDTRRFISGVVRHFDCTVEKVFKQYIMYLSAWSDMEHLPRIVLDTEWNFSLGLTKKMRCAAVMAPITFCSIITTQLNNVAERLQKRFSELDAQISEGEVFDDRGKLVDVSFNDKKQFVLAASRSAQAIFADEGNVTLGAAQFATSLCSCLPTAVRNLPPTKRQLLKLYQAMLNVASAIHFHMSRAQTMTKDARDLDSDQNLHVKHVLLHGYKFGFDFHRELHYLANESSAGGSKPSRFGAAANAEAALQRFRPRLRRADSVGSASQADVDIVANSVSFSPRASPTTTEASRDDTKDYPFDDQYTYEDSKNRVQDMQFMKEAFFGKQPTADETTPKTHMEFHALIARKLIDFAKHWMKFVLDMCERGRGLRPRWANNGLEFLMLACDPNNTKYLSDEEFEELKTMMDGCISHVVGSSNSSGSIPTSPAIPHRPAPPPPTSTPSAAKNNHYKTPLRHPQHTLRLNTSLNADPPTPPTPPMEPKLIVEFPLPQDLNERQGRVLSAISTLESGREEALRNQGCLGRAISQSSESSSGGTTPEPKLRQLNFQWQRGIKIGAGRFGKVYTVVNTESGQLLAMKEVSLGPGDWKAVQKAANELKVLEGVLHPHLVRYFGCEIYREEMLIFMELCVEGSLDSLLAHVGAPGLPEQQVRRYSRQLVTAVAELHNRQIAHRDIKTANIFLTNDGHCLKLGDFGCAVKIRANSTVPGELQGYVGTQAYMAPEVFMKSSGHGRLADVWSVGCVVTEMASGKRPFSEYDSNYQIMFVVGMGGRPDIPSQLSQEGQEFCMACLTHELPDRPRAVELLGHHFLMVEPDDCNCQETPPPLFNSSKKADFNNYNN